MPEEIYHKAMDNALNWLNRRMLSQKQLEDKLKQRGYQNEIIEKIITRLKEIDLIDDEKFGQALIREQVARKPAGKRLLSQKLWQKGLTQDVINKLIAQWHDNPENDPYLGALELAKKKFNSFPSNLEPARRKNRLQSMLARRGFSWDIIYRVLEDIEI